MKSICIALILFVLMGCSSTKIHLYTRYLSADDIEKITLTLEDLNFDVAPNNHAYPDDVSQSTLLYSPFMEQKEEGRIDKLVSSLNNIGWFIPSVQPLFTNNHSYTKNSAGLLLLPEGGIQNDKVALQDLSNNYKSTDCEKQVTLNLAKDNSYKLSYANNSNKRTEHLEGTWRVTHYPYIELVSLKEEWRFYFEIEKSRTTDLVSQIDLVVLKVVEKHHVFPNCNFSYGLRI